MKEEKRKCHLCGSIEKDKFCTNTSCYEYTRYEEPKMTKLERQCKDMADVCELAHKRTVRDIRIINKTYGLHHKVNCESLSDCGDDGNAHKGEKEHDECGTHYGMKAQEIFNDHYDHICEVTGI